MGSGSELSMRLDKQERVNELPVVRDLFGTEEVLTYLDAEQVAEEPRASG